MAQLVEHQRKELNSLVQILAQTRTFFSLKLLYIWPVLKPNFHNKVLVLLYCTRVYKYIY